MKPLAALLAVLCAGAVSAEELPSVSGYYEGTVRYSAEYFRDRQYTSMALGCESDFWFVVDEEGNLTGAGDAFYDFSFSVAWDMATSVGISVMNVLGASVDPQVTLTLDPSTVHQRYYLTGNVQSPPEPGAPGELLLRFSWTAPDATAAQAPALKLNLVGTVGGTVGLSAGGDANAAGSVGVSGDLGSVRETITWTPVPPFGQDEARVTLGLRSDWGPFSADFHYDGLGTSAATGVVVDWIAVQKIDFAAQREIARLRARVEELEQ